ncbi:MAG: hypothetical protein OHK0012_26010 [Synechococcales cyanobacterium]
MTPEDVRQDYHRGLLPDPAYLYYLIRALRKEGWRLKIESVDSFCQEWGITRSSFYRAKAKLISLHLIQEEIQGPLEVWAKPLTTPPFPLTDAAATLTSTTTTPPWITETGRIDPEFWEFILQERVRKLPHPPPVPRLSSKA